jgi:N-acyl-phosphatidylethanolamine-hydrolysing phospholipase D
VTGLVAAVLLHPTFTMPDAESVGRLAPSHHRDRGFRNTDASYAYPVTGRLVRLIASGLRQTPERGPAPRVLANDGEALRANGRVPTVTWVGHSTFLVQLDGVNILTDPQWADRASPVGFAGPRRLVPPGMRIEDLPPIHAVVISHDHYDHLDAPTLDRLARAHRPRFFVPLGIRAWLAGRDIRDVVELDWWESASFRGLTVVCTPAQHSSGRGLHDQNQRLWASWVVLGGIKRFFFAGDTGYWVGLREIGDRYGPFDLAAIPIGGYTYSRRRHPNHLSPEEAIQAFEDVGGRLLVPMHWGTFDMNREPFREPPERLLAEALHRGLEERIGVLSPGQSIPW